MYILNALLISSVNNNNSMTHNKKKITSFIGLSKTYVVNQSSNCLNFTHLIERFKERERAM